MKIVFKNHKKQKLFSSQDNLRAKFGPVMAKKIALVINSLRPMNSFAEVKGLYGKTHSLSQDKTGCVAIHVSANYRLLVEPKIPEGVSQDSEFWSKVTEVYILDCTDYH